MDRFVEVQFSQNELITILKILRNILNKKELELTISKLDEMEKIDIKYVVEKLMDEADLTSIYFDDEDEGFDD